MHALDLVLDRAVAAAHRADANRKPLGRAMAATAAALASPTAVLLGDSAPWLAFCVGLFYCGFRLWWTVALAANIALLVPRLRRRQPDAAARRGEGALLSSAIASALVAGLCASPHTAQWLVWAAPPLFAVHALAQLASRRAASAWLLAGWCVGGGSTAATAVLAHVLRFSRRTQTIAAGAVVVIALVTLMARAEENRLQALGVPKEEYLRVLQRIMDSDAGSTVAVGAPGAAPVVRRRGADSFVKLMRSMERRAAADVRQQLLPNAAELGSREPPPRR